MSVHQFIELSFSAYEKALGIVKCTRPCVVKPGFPILWFGDLDAFLAGDEKERSVSVGVNPSAQELKCDKTGHFVRFPNLVDFDGSIDYDQYREAMNDYFKKKEYKWFSKGMGPLYTSYKDGRLIHIDCCSSIATRPSWSGLCKNVKDYLRDINRPIFEDFLRFLNPTTVYIASNKEEFSYIKKVCKKVLGLPESSYISIYKYKSRAKEDSKTIE